ncbi:MAG: hypothetical protein ABIU95_08440 [Burkholderiales bacterium]
MDLFMLIGLLLLIVAPFHLAMRYELTRMTEPQTIRARGVVLPSVAELDDIGPPIGPFGEKIIHETVNFLGQRYDYDRIAPPRYRNLLRPEELFLSQGLVYVARR